MMALKVIRGDQTLWPERHEHGVDTRYVGLAGLGAPTRLVRLGEQGLAARRAGGAREEPPVNASDVEAMVALGQDLDVLPGLEVREADGAHRAGGVELQPGRVDHDRHGAHGLPPQPALGQPRDPAGLRVRRRRPAGTPQRAPHDRVEPQRADERAEEDGEDHHHVRVEVAPRGAAVGHRLAWSGGLPPRERRSVKQRPS
uniref:Uncharacterized protein n=1 Tax=Triticum urartu TaxID=4572 RepID=A0A8R7TIW0_TRIUA